MVWINKKIEVIEWINVIKINYDRNKWIIRENERNFKKGIKVRVNNGKVDS
jgi:hypothetical protein